MSVKNETTPKNKIRLELSLEGEIADAFDAYKRKIKLQKNATTAFKLVADALEREGFLMSETEQTAKAA